MVNLGRFRWFFEICHFVEIFNKFSEIIHFKDNSKFPSEIGQIQNTHILMKQTNETIHLNISILLWRIKKTSKLFLLFSNKSEVTVPQKTDSSQSALCSVTTPIKNIFWKYTTIIPQTSGNILTHEPYLHNVIYKNNIWAQRSATTVNLDRTWSRNWTEKCRFRRDFGIWKQKNAFVQKCRFGEIFQSYRDVVLGWFRGKNK